VLWTSLIRAQRRAIYRCCESTSIATRPRRLIHQTLTACPIAIDRQHSTRSRFAVSSRRRFCCVYGLLDYAAAAARDADIHLYLLEQFSQPRWCVQLKWSKIELGCHYSTCHNFNHMQCDLSFVCSFVIVIYTSWHTILQPVFSLQLRLSVNRILGVVRNSTVWVKKVATPKTFCGISSPGEPVWLKITLVISQTYSYVYTNFGPFIWIFVRNVSLLPLSPLKF